MVIIPQSGRGDFDFAAAYSRTWLIYWNSTSTESVTLTGSVVGGTTMQYGYTYAPEGTTFSSIISSISTYTEALLPTTFSYSTFTFYTMDSDWMESVATGTVTGAVYSTSSSSYSTTSRTTASDTGGVTGGTFTTTSTRATTCTTSVTSSAYAMDTNALDASVTDAAKVGVTRSSIVVDYGDSASLSPGIARETARLYQADIGSDLIVFTGTGIIPVTAGVRTESTLISEKLIASGAAAGLGSATSTITATIGTASRIRLLNSTTNLTYTKALPYAFPASTSTYAERVSFLSTSVTTGTTSAETYTAHATSVGSQVDIVSGTRIIGLLGDSTATILSGNVGTSMSTYVGSGSADTVVDGSTARLTRSVSLWESLATLDRWDFPSIRAVGITQTKTFGFKAADSAYSAESISLGLSGAAGLTLGWGGNIYSSISQGVMVSPPKSISGTTLSAGSTISMTVTIGSSGGVSSSWSASGWTDSSARSGTMHLAAASSPGTSEFGMLGFSAPATCNDTAFPAVYVPALSGPCRIIAPAGILMMTDHTGGTSSDYSSADRCIHTTFTAPMAIEHVPAVVGPCIFEIPKFA